MYDYEILEIMKQYNYHIPSKILSEIELSPQLDHRHYESYGDYYEIWSKNGLYVKFTVYCEK